VNPCSIDVDVTIRLGAESMGPAKASRYFYEVFRPSLEVCVLVGLIESYAISAGGEPKPDEATEPTISLDLSAADLDLLLNLLGARGRRSAPTSPEPARAEADQRHAAAVALLTERMQDAETTLELLQ